MEQNKDLQAALDFYNNHAKTLSIRNLLLPEEGDRLTFGDKAADFVADYGGSWAFVLSFMVLMVAWVTINSIKSLSYDPYPFILLNLFLSTLAALQSPIILMSQKRQDKKDRIKAENDFRVNLVSEFRLQEANIKIQKILDEIEQIKGRLNEIEEKKQ